MSFCCFLLLLLFVVAVVFLSTYYTRKDEYGLAADPAGSEGHIEMQAVVRVQESKAGVGHVVRSGDGLCRSVWRL
jgi:hypothetical protein